MSKGRTTRVPFHSRSASNSRSTRKAVGSNNMRQGPPLALEQKGCKGGAWQCWCWWFIWVKMEFCQLCWGDATVRLWNLKDFRWELDIRVFFNSCSKKPFVFYWAQGGGVQARGGVQKSYQLATTSWDSPFRRNPCSEWCQFKTFIQDRTVALVNTTLGCPCNLWTYK